MASPVLVLVTDPTDSVSHRTGPGFQRADADAAHVRIDDRGLTHGDGFFETVGVSRSRALALTAHLSRFASSARLLQIAEPALAVWRAATLAAIEFHEGAAELSAKLVMTRGVNDRPSGWVLVETAPDFRAARTDGIRVITLDRGVRHDAAQASPWLLLGAKTLSYAVNLAALREAGRRGADDVVFVSSDGFVLEGATSSVIVRRGERVCTPATELSILAGTTQARAFGYFASRGIRTEYCLMTIDELRGADAAWLVSSVRQAAPVRAIDGRELAVDAVLTGELNDHLLSAGD